ncbi:MAG: hypothetical protein IIA89_08080 [Chloroflexi bacterium]|nr:hypothetical protein [Chloroflexota bacterium]
MQHRETSPALPGHPSRFSRLLWFIITTVSWTLGWALALTLVNQIPLSLIRSSPSLSFLIVPITAGGVIGLGQWLTLRRSLIGAWKWVPATVVGMVLAVVALIFGIILATGALPADLSQNSGSQLASWLVPPLFGGLLAGTLAGTSQWLVLRGHSGAQARQLPAMVLGWAVGLAVIGVTWIFTFLLAVSDVPPELSIVGAVGGAFGGAVVGIATGPAVASQLRSG